ncbi:MAG: deoxyguanosinetriphosphate triphosphohydrolase [Clostridiales bacterium]
MCLRKEIEKNEEKSFSQFAQLTKNTKGRKKHEKKCDLRTEYQRDRDRIIYSKSFRRLKHKTQVFFSPEGDHYRTRLTHTLEVSQIARTIARGLKLNEDLTESISLGHDLGHTPFGHSGEFILNRICLYGFKHYEQSVRVVDILERKGGLNLTWEVCDGILNHTGNNMASTLEGQIVKYADKIAYINHDIEDAVRGKVLSNGDLPKECINFLGERSSERINNMITNIISNSEGKNEVKMSKDFFNATMELRKFMFDNVYQGTKSNEEVKVQKLIKELYYFLIENIDCISDELKEIVDCNDRERLVCDYIAGMTDRYAIKKFKEIFIPIPWLE